MNIPSAVPVTFVGYLRNQKRATATQIATKSNNLCDDSEKDAQECLHNKSHLSKAAACPHLLSDPGLILATVEAATGSPGPEPNVTFPSVARPPVLSRDLQRKLGKASSSNL